MRFQRGQSIVEFALVLPLFLLFTFSIIYFGCVFADYVTLGTIARSSARAAVVLQQEDAAKQQGDYQKIREGFKGQKLPFDIYKWDSGDKKYFDIQYKNPTDSAPNGNVEVTVNAELQGFGKTLVHIINGLTDSNNTGNLSITYTMYSEYNWSNKK
ncbi:TadE/TadG family type IV pilus assembly protein [Mitsuokella multacida]|uniref:TadE/TadG family type IV pilus assembly protein n=1 Tax=Mitsuokella multacida TaxID=52226 RepID=UPI0026660BE0|nr:TadE family protein [Mitsuokella multacida]